MAGAEDPRVGRGGGAHRLRGIVSQHGAVRDRRRRPGRRRTRLPRWCRAAGGCEIGDIAVGDVQRQLRGGHAPGHADRLCARSGRQRAAAAADPGHHQVGPIRTSSQPSGVPLPLQSASLPAAMSQSSGTPLPSQSSWHSSGMPSGWQSALPAARSCHRRRAPRWRCSRRGFPRRCPPGRRRRSRRSLPVAVDRR